MYLETLKTLNCEVFDGAEYPRVKITLEQSKTKNDIE